MGATGTRMVKVQTEIEVPTRDLVRVLVIDDESSITDSWQRLFEDDGYSVDTAAHPDEALSLLKHERYDVVVSDISFDNTLTTGDELIANNKKLMGDASVVAITAYGKDQVKRLKDLTDMGVPVLEKGKGDDELERIVQEKLEDRQREIAALAQESLKPILQEALSGNNEALEIRTVKADPAGHEYLLNQVRGMLTDWFRTRRNPNARTIVYGGRTFSANELACEVEEGTEIGLEHMETMIDLFKECLRLK